MPLDIGGSLLAIFALAYIVYQRYLHPLAKYPGPFLASFTDLWQVNQFLSLQQPYNLTKLLTKYGPIVRYGPDKLSITHKSAIPVIYQKVLGLCPRRSFMMRMELHIRMSSECEMKPYVMKDSSVCRQKVTEQSTETCLAALC
jgi:hypothetical protein